MKKIFILILTIISFNFLYSQNISNRASSNVTVQDGRWKALYNAVLPAYIDTTAANVQKGLDSCGALIFIYNGNKLFRRACSPKRWLEVGGTGSGSITNITFFTDSSLIICFSDGVCDTISFTNNIFITNSTINNTIHGDTLISCTTTNNVTVCDTLIFDIGGDTIFNYYFLDDSTMVACGDTTIVCNGTGNCEIVQQCDTINIPRIQATIYQVGVQMQPQGVVELGIDWNGYDNPNVGLISTWLNRDKVIHTAGATFRHMGWPILDPVTATWSMQAWNLNTDVSTFLNNGSPEAADLDNNNRVKFHIGYTGNHTAAYNRGYFQNYIGYWLGANFQGAPNYGLLQDNQNSKFGGAFIHTFDTLNNRSVTIFGNRPVLAEVYGQMSVDSSNLIRTQIASFNYNKIISFII